MPAQGDEGATLPPSSGLWRVFDMCCAPGSAGPGELPGPAAESVGTPAMLGVLPQAADRRQEPRLICLGGGAELRAVGKQGWLGTWVFWQRQLGVQDLGSGSASSCCVTSEPVEWGGVYAHLSHRDPSGSGTFLRCPEGYSAPTPHCCHLLRPLAQTQQRDAF